jgi:hypothetical protein
VMRLNELDMTRVRDVLDPLAHPRDYERRTMAKTPWSENDRVRIGLTQGDLWRIQILAGQVTVMDLKALPSYVRPSPSFIDEMAELEDAVERAARRAVA